MSTAAERQIPPLGTDDAGGAYSPRRAAETVLYRVVAENLETFLARAREADRGVPRFVEREFRRYLECGILAHGFLRVRCDECGCERLVPFSCKGRGFCSSCVGRRMADTAAHLVDRVLPEAPVRQWVLTLPWALRYRMAYGTSASNRQKFTRDYFDEIEAHRYSTEPEILSFADFKSARGKRVLEVGVGAGTDFLQWVRAAAIAHGVDLTREAVEHVNARLRVYGLQAEDVRVADCESLPFENDMFDLVYSWGVIHHTPDTYKALAEIVRVCRPGGTCKIMLYNRHSVLACDLWIRKALRKFKPFRSLARVIYHHMESEGTKAYTPREIRSMLDERHPVSRFAANAMAKVLGGRKNGWFMLVDFAKTSPG